jgi:2-dehydropantoate 2-reductase
MRSSMLAAIERGRPPAVDFLNGEIVERGAKFGLPTPINAAVREQVLDIARGKAKSSLTLARELFDRTRPLVTRDALAEAAAKAATGAPQGASRRPSATVALGPAAGALKAAPTVIDDTTTGP